MTKTIVSISNFKILYGRFIVILLVLLFLSPIALAETDHEKRAVYIGKAIDTQMAELRTAIASNDEARVRAYLQVNFPILLAAETDAKLSAYVQAAKGQQVKAKKGSVGLNSCVASLMATSGYSGYVADGLNLVTLGNVGALGDTLDGTLGNLGDLGLLLAAYDCYTKFSEGKLDDGTKDAAMIAVYAKLAGSYLGRFGNVMGAAANTGYNLGMYARGAAVSDAEAAIFKKFEAYWRTQFPVKRDELTMWMELWDREGHAGVLKALQIDGFWTDEDMQTDLLAMRNQWALPTWKKDYKKVLGARYFRENLAHVLALHAKRRAEDLREKIITNAQRFIENFPQMKITLVTLFYVVDDNGNRVDVDPAHVLVGLYANGEKLADIPFADGQQISVTMNLKNFCEAIGKAGGEIKLETFWRRTAQAAQKAPDKLGDADQSYDPKTGLVRATFNSRTYTLSSRKSSQRHAPTFGESFQIVQQANERKGKDNYIRLGRLKLSFDPIPIPFRVIDEKGKPVQGATLKALWGSVKTDQKGMAEVPIGLTGKSLVSVYVGNNRTGDYLILTGLDAFKNPTGIRTITLGRGRAPSLETFGIEDSAKASAATMKSFPEGKTSYAFAASRLRRTTQAVKNASMNANAAWALYENAQSAAISKRYSSNGKGKQAAMEALWKKRSSYLKQFSAAQLQQKTTASRLQTMGMGTAKQIKGTHDQAYRTAEKLASMVGEARKRLGRLNVLMNTASQQAKPRSFKTLADVQKDRQKLAAAITEAETISRELKDDLNNIRSQIDRLGIDLAVAAKHRTQGSGLVEVSRFESQMGQALASADGVLRSVNGTIVAEKGLITTEMLRWADSLLGGVQILALQDQTLMNEYDNLAKSGPMKLADPKGVSLKITAAMASFNEVKTAIGMTLIRGRAEALKNVASRNRAAEEKRWQQYGHKGFGVNAYQKWLVAEKDYAAPPQTLTLASSKEAIQQWYDQLAAKGKVIQARLAAMSKSGWSVDEIVLAMSKRAGVPDEVKSLRRFSIAADTLETTRDSYQERMKNCYLKRLDPAFSFEKLLPASLLHASLIETGLIAAKAGNLAKAEASRDEAADTIKPFYPSRGRTYLELITFCGPDHRNNQIQLDSMISQLHLANYATLTVALNVPAGLNCSRLKLDLRDAKGQQAVLRGQTQTPQGTVYTLEPQTVILSASMPGATVSPETQTVTLPPKGKLDVTLTIKPTIGSGGATAATGKYNFKTPTATMLCDMIMDDSEVVRWSDDSAYIIKDSLQRISLTSGKITQYVTEFRDPSNPQATPVKHHAVEPHVLGGQVVYRSNLGGNWLMTTPLMGGESKRLARIIWGDLPYQEQMSLLDVRAGKSPEFLFHYRVNPHRKEPGAPPSRMGLWVVPGPIPDLRKGRWIGHLAEGQPRAVVCHNWKLAACASLQNGKNLWVLYSVPQNAGPMKKIGEIPAMEAVRSMAFSPDGKYIVTVRYAKAVSGGLVLGIRPLARPTQEMVIFRGAIAYGTPSWSRDGRFIALRVFSQPGAPTRKSSLMVIQVAGKPFPFNTTTFRGDPTQVGVGKDPDPDVPAPNAASKKRLAELEYVAAYNKFTGLMKQGKENSPEVQAAYKAYRAAKARYEALLP